MLHTQGGCLNSRVVLSSARHPEDTSHYGHTHLTDNHEIYLVFRPPNNQFTS